MFCAKKGIRRNVEFYVSGTPVNGCNDGGRVRDGYYLKLRLIFVSMG